MTRDDIIRLAREARFLVEDSAFGADVYEKSGNVSITTELEHFAALVAAAEREACAKVCEDIPLPKDAPALTHLPTIERCADAIRARSET